VVGDGGHLQPMNTAANSAVSRGQAGFSRPLPPATLAAARSGDKQAQGEIYDLYADAVYTLALRTSGCADQAQDLAHDAFINGFRGLASYRGEAPFGMWLRQITARVAVAHVRREKPRLVTSLDAAEEQIAHSVDPSAGCDLQRQLARLPTQTRTVLWLHLAEGYGHEEIAALFGKSVSFSKSQVARSLNRLRLWMS